MRLRRPTSAWTDTHSRVAVVLLVTVAGSLVGLADDSRVAVWVGVAVATTAMVSLATDAFGGFVAGLAAAAAVIAARRWVGPWGPDAFWASLLQTAALLAAGVASGRTGMALRRRGTDDAPSLLPAPVFGSLGLLDADVAMGRLEEEVERARQHRRPLTLILLEAALADTLDPDEHRSVLRAVARIFEGRLEDGDVPFAIAADRLGAVLPESTSLAAWDRLGQILDAVSAGRYSRGPGVEQGSLDDVVAVHVGVAELGPGTSGANELFDAATDALRRSIDRATATADASGR